jgi:hypothetical protein
MDTPVLAAPRPTRRLLAVALLLPLLGLLIALLAAAAGQDVARRAWQTEMDKGRYYWENELARAELRHQPPAKLAELQKCVADFQPTQMLSYLQPGRQFTWWDGYRYEEIITDGYLYHRPNDPKEIRENPIIPDPLTAERRIKNVVWYPLYPLLGAIVSRVTTLPPHHALTLVSAFSIVLASLLFVAFCRRHFAAQALPSPELAALFALGCLLLGPCSIFLYANFTESLFVLLLVAFLCCLQQRWWWRAAVVAAFASATRSQGVLFGPILALVFLLRASNYRLFLRLPLAVVLGFISGLGVLAYMIYLQRTFGDALAFMHAQIGWNVGINGATLKEALNPVSALSHLLYLSFYKPPTEWPRIWEACCLLWPPIILFFGRRRLSLELALVGWILWALPYISNSLAGNPPSATKWMSMGRFMAVLLPAQIIAGAWLAGPATLAPENRSLLLRRWILAPLWIAIFAIFAYKFGAGEWVG